MMSVLLQLAKSLTSSAGATSQLRQAIYAAPTVCKRLLTTRATCAQSEGPRCSPEKMAAQPCVEEANPMKKGWFNPACCNNPCMDALPRFDDLYYKASDKYKRKYRQTWVECPKLKLAPRKICCFESVKYPPLERRPRKVRCYTACDVSFEDRMMLICKNRKNLKCPKITLPGCCGARDPPKCTSERRPANCKKVCAPYPSYSECCRPKPKPLRQTECNCLYIGPYCRSS